MIKREVRRADFGSQEVFVDQDTGKEYQRIVGSLAWPHVGKPGFALVLGEDFEEESNFKDRHLWVLKEVEESDVADLLRRCQTLREVFQAKDWFGDIWNRPMMAVLHHLDKEIEIKNWFSVGAALYADDPRALGYYLPLIREHIGNRKILHFGKESKLAGYVAQAGPEALGQAPAEYPPIAALGYALSYLVIHRPDPVSPERRPTYSGPSSWMAS